MTYNGPTSFGFMDRYAGLDDGSEMGSGLRAERREAARLGNESRRLSIESQRRGLAYDDSELRHEQLRLSVDTSRMQNELARRDYNETIGSDNVLERAFAGLSSGGPDAPPSAASTALGYAPAMARIKGFVLAGEFEKAYGEYRTSLDGPSRTFTDEHLSYSSTKPRNEMQRALQVGSYNLNQRVFDREPIQLPGGEVTTLYEMFFDGEKYKDFQKASLIRKHLGGLAAADYNSDDVFVKETTRSIVDPMAASGQSGKPALPYQRAAFADYFSKHKDDMRRDLGDDGVTALVAYACDVAIRDGTAQDAAGFVTGRVAEQLAANPALDKSKLVHDAITTFDRIRKMSSDEKGNVAPEAARLSAKLAVWGAEQGVTDFSNPDVQSRLGELTMFTSTLTKLGIPFLSESFLNRSGAVADIRKSMGTMLAAAQNGTEVPETDYVLKAEQGLQLCKGLLASGTAESKVRPTGNPRDGRGDYEAVFGRTSGVPQVNAALLHMTRTLYADHVLPALAADGANARDAVLAALSDPGLVQDWARDIGSYTGLSKRTSEFLAARLAASAQSGGGVRPAGLLDDMVRIASTRLVTDPDTAAARAEIMPWLTAENASGDLFAARTEELMQHLHDPVVGPGLRTKDEIDAYLGVTARAAASYARNGQDFNLAYDAAMNKGVYYDQVRADFSGEDHGPSVCGKVRLKDGREVYVVPSRTHKNWYERQSPQVQERLVLDNDPVLAEGSVPVIAQYATDDLNSVALPGFSGGAISLNGVPAGMYKANRRAFRLANEQRKVLFDNVLKGAGKVSADFAKPSER